MKGWERSRLIELENDAVVVFRLGCDKCKFFTSLDSAG